jgi:hypothetical protein
MVGERRLALGVSQSKLVVMPRFKRSSPREHGAAGLALKSCL